MTDILNRSDVLELKGYIPMRMDSLGKRQASDCKRDGRCNQVDSRWWPEQSGRERCSMNTLSLCCGPACRNLKGELRDNPESSWSNEPYEWSDIFTLERSGGEHRGIRPNSDNAGQL